MFHKLAKVLTSFNRPLHKYAFKMDRAYLRHLVDEDRFQLSFRYVDVERKVNRQFNFSRQASETVGTFLSRVSTNVEKAVSKKKRKKEEPCANADKTTVDVALYLDGTRVVDDAVCRDVFTNCGRVVIKLLERELDVVVDAPFVDGLSLPASVMAEFPAYPAKFECVNTDLGESSFKWYRLSDGKKDWEWVGDGFVYYPSNADVGGRLKMVCVPRNGGLEGPEVEADAGCKVEAGPGPCPFETRHGFTRSRCAGNAFRVVSYNLLADVYCDMETTRTEWYPYCPPYALDLNYRKQLFLKELDGYNADILCLQEVDRKVHRHDLAPFFGATFDSRYSQKGANVAEGVACFYRLDRFKLIEGKDILISDLVKESSAVETIRNRIAANEKLVERFNERNSVLQVVLLEHVERGNLVIVANTHLYFHPNADHVRLLQAAACIKYVEQFCSDLKLQYSDKTISVVFCGDFNSVPECGIYKLFTTGFVGSDCVDWSSCEEEAVTDLEVRQSLRLGSACGTPTYTNYTAGFKDCLDYVFYDETTLRVVQTVPLPDEEELSRHLALPSVVFPSDHVSLVADLEFTS